MLLCRINTHGVYVLTGTQMYIQINTLMQLQKVEIITNIYAFNGYYFYDDFKINYLIASCIFVFFKNVNIYVYSLLTTEFLIVLNLTRPIYNNVKLYVFYFHFLIIISCKTDNVVYIFLQCVL